jgi:hypothetical protein
MHFVEKSVNRLAVGKESPENACDCDLSPRVMGRVPATRWVTFAYRLCIGWEHMCHRFQHRLYRGIGFVTGSPYSLMKNELAQRVDHADDLDIGAGADAVMLAELAALEPGPLVMMVLSGIDPATLDDDGRLDYAREWDRQQRWVG